MAILSLAETMRSDPAKYSSIIHYIDKSSSLATVDYTPSQHYAASYMYGPAARTAASITEQLY